MNIKTSLHSSYNIVFSLPWTVWNYCNCTSLLVKIGNYMSLNICLVPEFQLVTHHKTDRQDLIVLILQWSLWNIRSYNEDGLIVIL